MLNSVKTTFQGHFTEGSANASFYIANALDALEHSEKETNTVEMGYTQQKGIGAKPSLLSTGETLRTFNLPLKLHYSFCNPQKVIDEIEQKVLNSETFLYFQGDKYKGRFVFNKAETNTISRISGNIICAELTVSLLEAPYSDEEEFKQQKKQIKKPEGKLQSIRNKLKVPVKLKNALDKIPDFIKVKGLGYLDDKTGGLVSTALSSDSLLDVALRKTRSYLNVKTSGISEDILNNRGQLDDLIE